MPRAADDDDARTRKVHLEGPSTVRVHLAQFSTGTAPWRLFVAISDSAINLGSQNQAQVQQKPEFGPALPYSGHQNRHAAPYLSGFPAHVSCWKILDALLSSVRESHQNRPTSSQIQTPNDQHLLTLYHILSTTGADSNLMVWPHGYHTVQDLMTSANSTIGNEDPLAYGICSLLNPAYRYHTFARSAPKLRFDDGIPIGYRCINPSFSSPPDSESYTTFIPDFLPLPTEIVTNILCLLSGSDIDALQSIESKNRIEVSELVWKRVVLQSDDLGFLCLGDCRRKNDHKRNSLSVWSRDLDFNWDLAFNEKDRYWVEGEVRYTWREIYEIARYHTTSTTDSSPLSNRHRVYQMCKALANQVDDIANARHASLHPVASDDDELSTSGDFGDKLTPHTLYSRVENLGLWSETKIKRSLYSWVKFDSICPNSEVESIAISYSGSGRYMTFVSGIQCFPSGHSIGYITANQRIVNVSDAKVLTIMMAKYGLIDISFSETIDSLNWADRLEYGDKYFEGMAVSRKFLGQCDKGWRQMKISTKLDAAKIVSILIECPDILPLSDLNPQEHIYQSCNPWVYGDSLAGLTLTRFDLPGAEAKLAPHTTQLRFGDRMLERITGWVIAGENTLNGICFHFVNDQIELTLSENHPHTPDGSYAQVVEPNHLTIGRAHVGLPIDFLISGESGEYLTGVDIFYWENIDLLAGLKFYTNWNRVGEFTASKIKNANPSDMIQKGKLECHQMDVPRGHHIVGFFTPKLARHTRFVDIAFIGTLSEPHPSIIELPPIVDPENLQICSAVSNPEIPDWNYPQTTYYSSEAPTSGVSRITCYRDHSYGVPINPRLNGLLLHYKPEVPPDGSPPRQSRLLLGHMGASRRCNDEFDIDVDAGEQIVSIDQHIIPSHQQYPGSNIGRAISAIRVNTSFGRSIFWPSEQESGLEDEYNLRLSGTKAFRLDLTLEDQPILRWDYHESLSALFVTSIGLFGVDPVLLFPDAEPNRFAMDQISGTQIPYATINNFSEDPYPNYWIDPLADFEVPRVPQ
ncbi:hypothetical protein H072_3660 [Dactylellina haptotyla CBS 200.50]|uniref:F-box domain-containing protein n=1 Tax=Dactylellina haptotyla (strain CBS 200.50) TaxID=1284197 RepID=S8AMP8_DACHA|nr:hypothetical protein H072_3660 [Dactylellina haptotyla CBS 200.50]